MLRIKDIIDKKGRQVIHITPQSELFDAVKTLADNKIGSLLVVTPEGKIAGIITERDIFHEVYRRKGDLSGVKVADIMTADVVVGSLEDDLDYAMYMMTKKKFRHMPIADQGELVGMISIGDIIGAMMSQREYENRMLKDYIYGPVKD